MIKSEKLIEFLSREEQLLNELLSLTESQQKALIVFDTSALENIAAKQTLIMKEIRVIEDKRINFLMSLFGITRKEATNITISELNQIFKENDENSIEIFKSSMEKIIAKINNNNILNRVLANRARNSIREILSHLTNGTNRVCNVTI